MRVKIYSDRFMGTVATDNRGNAIFPHYDSDGITGFTAKNENYTGFSKGGERKKVGEIA